VEKTSVFGTSVHAVLRSSEIRPDEIAARLSATGLPATCSLVDPSLEDVFLEVAERRTA
jgi:hypothetical protein